MGAITPAVRRSAGQIEALITQALAQAQRPLSAYAIARVISEDGAPVMPGQIYRTLERLIAQRRVLRIEMLNAYWPWPPVGDLCLICTACHGVTFAQAPVLAACVARVRAAQRFEPPVGLTEAMGRCSACGEGSSGSAS